MYYVYLIRSIKDPENTYIGHTKNIANRLSEHNMGKSAHTSKHKPWKLISCIAVESKEQSIALERYLKSGAGRNFAKKYLL